MAKKKKKAEPLKKSCKTVVDKIANIKKQLEGKDEEEEFPVELSQVMFELTALQRGLDKLKVRPVDPHKEENARDPEYLGEDYLDFEWIEPSDEKASKSRDINQFKGGKADFFATSDDELGQMGVGVALYFQFLMCMSTLMFVLCVINIPALVLNRQGHGVTPEQADGMGFAYFTMGNLVCSSLAYLIGP